MAACDEARRLLAKAGEDEERLARQEVRENSRRLRGWVEARLAADEKPGHG
jgi:hypothetical protein